MDTSTVYLLLGMAGFLLTTMVLVHHHNCAEQVNRARIAAREQAAAIKNQTYRLEAEAKKIQMKIEEIEDQLDTFTY